MHVFYFKQTFGQKMLGDFVWIISFLISFSTIGSLSASILGSSRVYYTAARDGKYHLIIRGQ